MIVKKGIKKGTRIQWITDNPIKHSLRGCYAILLNDINLDTEDRYKRFSVECISGECKNMIFKDSLIRYFTKESFEIKMNRNGANNVA